MTMFEQRACRVCGCTETNACEGGCWWVEHDLCSACVQQRAIRKRWSPADDAFLRGNAAMPLDELAQALGCTASAVKNRIHNLGVKRPSRCRWTPAMDAVLIARYANERSADLEQELGLPPNTAGGRARALGLKKSAEFLASERSGRMQPGQISEAARRSQFKKGIVPANKGLRRPGYAPGRMAETQFKRGEMAGAAQNNYVPIGTLRVRDGLLCRKMTDDPALYPAARWKPVSRLVWEAAHGPVPAGHVVRFKDGQKTLVLEEITLDRLECVTKAEAMRKNSYWRNYPHEVGELIQLKGRLTHRINKRMRSGT